MKILILSRNSALYSTSSLIQAARKRGHEVLVFDHLMCNMLIRKGKLQILTGHDIVEDIDAVIPRIGASSTSYGAAIVRQFEGMGVFTTVKADALLKARNKLTCMQILASHNIDIPNTGISAGDTCGGTVFSHISTDKAVIKLLSSTQGLGVILANSKMQGQSILEGFHQAGQDVLIQEFIADAKGADIRAFIVDGKIVGSMIRQAIPGEFRSNIHRGASSHVVQLTPKEKQIALKATKILGLDIAGVDILRSSRGPLILEVNASPGLEGIEGTTRVDIAGKIIEFIERSVKNKNK
jgi:ribosomal protein S6--L-glutamate ligase